MLKIHFLYILFFILLTPLVSLADFQENLRLRTIDFTKFSDQESIPPTTTGKAGLGIHIEENHLSYTSPKKLMMRHAETAAFALQYSAYQISGYNVPTESFDINPFAGGIIDSKNTSQEFFIDKQILSHALSKATAISLSMNTNSHSRVSISKKDIPSLFAQWQKSDTIFSQSAGNRGSQCDALTPQITDQQEFVFHQLADTYIKVGSAIIDSDDIVKVKDKSSCSAPDIVALNPYLQGLKYQFRPTPDEYDELLKKYLPDFEGVEKATQTLTEKREGNLDSQGFMTNIGGNSFISPSVAGYFSGMKELCPQLNSFELLAGAFSYAQPVHSADNFPLNYPSNGALPYNGIRSGFGFLSIENYKQGMLQACSELQEQKSLQSLPEFIDHVQDYDSKNAHDDNKNKEIQFTINEDILVFRVILVMESNQGGIPYSLTLKHPNQFPVKLKPANANWQTPSWGLAASNGFFGTTSKGTWTISFDKYKNITHLKVKIFGVQKNSLVQKIIDNSNVSESIE